jgi:serine O-acetyltransferase
MSGSDNISDTISTEMADWTREQPKGFWDPGRKLLLSIRRFQHWRVRSGPLAYLACKWLVLRHRFWSAVSGADIPLNCQIGGGLFISHANGIVIHPSARIGVNCMIAHQVTLGVRSGPGAPMLGGHVDIGAGAKILGPVQVGDHARIGANAVVIADVPDNSTAVGIPAVIKPRRKSRIGAKVG